ncbi:unnamed protein product [Sphagnum compactum]
MLVLSTAVRRTSLQIKALVKLLSMKKTSSEGDLWDMTGYPDIAILPDLTLRISNQMIMLQEELASYGDLADSKVKSHCCLTSSPTTLIVKDVIVCPDNCQPCNSICTSASFHFLALLRNIFSETGRVGKALLRLIAVGENYLNVFWRIFQCEQQKCSSWIEMNKEAHKFVVNNQDPSSDD